MINAIQGYNTNFSGLNRLKPQKVTRNVVNTKAELPKGLSSSIRREDELDKLIQSVENRIDKITDNPSSPEFTTLTGGSSSALLALSGTMMTLFH